MFSGLGINVFGEVGKSAAMHISHIPHPHQPQIPTPKLTRHPNSQGVSQMQGRGTELLRCPPSAPALLSSTLPPRPMADQEQPPAKRRRLQPVPFRPPTVRLPPPHLIWAVNPWIHRLAKLGVLHPLGSPIGTAHWSLQLGDPAWDRTGKIPTVPHWPQLNITCPLRPHLPPPYPTNPPTHIVGIPTRAFTSVLKFLHWGPQV